MVTVVNPKFTHLYVAHCISQRVISVRLCLGPRGLAVSNVHFSHDNTELGENLAATSFNLGALTYSKSRKPEHVIVGDYNVNLLPDRDLKIVVQRLPKLQRSSLSGSMTARRDILDNFVKSSKLRMHVPVAIRGRPPGPHGDPLRGIVFSRMPEGNQLGYPSLLDYAVASGQFVCNPRLEWAEGLVSDHARFWINVRYAAMFPRRTIVTWIPSDYEVALFEAVNVQISDNGSLEQLADSITAFQRCNKSQLNRKARHRLRVPFQIRSLSRQVACMQSSVERAQLVAVLRRLRSHWHADLRKAAVQRRLATGGVIVKTKKLFEIAEIRDSQDVAIVDPNVASKSILHHFENKWDASNLLRCQRVCELPFDFPGLNFELLEIAACDIDRAFRCLKRLSRVDSHGISRTALFMVFQRQPEAFIRWFKLYICSFRQLRSSTCVARVYGKESTCTKATDVRMIIPLSSVLDLADALLQEKVNKVIDGFFEPMRNPFVHECARPRTQLLEITHTASFAAEKILDNKSTGTIAQMDIQKHFDSVDLLAVFAWLINAGLSPEWAIVAVWIQLLPTIIFRVLNVEWSLVSRSTGTLTGSRVASAMARVPVLDLIYANFNHLQPHMLCIGSWSALCATYVDNIIFLLASIADVPVVSRICEEYLGHKWGQCIKPSSKQALVFKGIRPPHAPDWDFCSSMRVLGVIVSASGSCCEDFAKVTRTLWASFWANAGATAAKSLTTEKKLALLKIATGVHLNGHIQSWAWTTTRANNLDSIQRKMIKIVMHRKLALQAVAPSHDPSADSMHLQIARSVKQVQYGQGRWSSLWVKRAHEWRSHCLRHAGNGWTGMVHRAIDEDELGILRALSGVNRPGTRRRPGWVAKRLSETYPDIAREYASRLNESKKCIAANLLL